MLTGREYEVLQLVAHGLRTHAIATQLGIAEATVVAFIRSARVKLGAKNRVQAAHLAAGGNAPAVSREALDPEQLRLLDLLAAGSTVDEAAAALYLSRRTVQRRLAEIRNALGVSTTAAAVASSVRLRDTESQVAGGAPDAVGIHPEEPERERRQSG
jgi:DNA-binding NarL/FixJ family response regulator